MSTTWSRYYDAAGEQPRETLLFALERFDAEAGAKGESLFAVDLGCGTGRDSAELVGFVKAIPLQIQGIRNR